MWEVLVSSHGSESEATQLKTVGEHQRKAGRNGSVAETCSTPVNPGLRQKELKSSCPAE